MGGQTANRTGGEDMDRLVRRITPLTVLPDIAPMLRQYQDLGFETVETGEPGCVGVRVGDTGLILATAEHMAADFGTAAAPLTGQTIPYIYVRSVADAAASFAPPATVVSQTLTRGKTFEALVERNGQHMILAEKC